MSEQQQLQQQQYLPYNQQENKYEVPSKQLRLEQDVEIFKKTKTFAEYMQFICDMQQSIKSKKISQTNNTGKFNKIIEYLVNLEILLKQTPPIQQPMRFGNKAFKDWHQQMCLQTDSFLKTLLPENLQGAIIELRVYLFDSYGSNVRLDYGTGHEMAFLFFLLALKKLGFYDNNDLEEVCRFVFYKYIDVMRQIQVSYMLEPAGSHGVWGLDDYHFIPFLLGASELINSDIVPSPSDIHNQQLLDHYQNEYMYLHCIDFIKKQKKGHFHEHSPILNDISGAANWNKVAQGMIKMYQAEVLFKFPVAKHIFFGSILPFV
ncbi:phosphotyrosyl phosphatase activator, putative [Ichthyophthirius multifiliis]|uniref:Serine/threonine-protein phosphatase 2A activator n=1 Tax=Ichthyophthirius multifiliis TaxID=5932 RepID=G0R374_ICHMU|nr:phosphotyrosyl phosphatase activator, putative [Ichthyophthirius multifiliis]EGR28097.1 phosphotyrosyl phosphatase activator, putative [Ichthyophthirius multifiliis]|eukprot:XP_004027442.1 phosphotyrosyl phosphatase activator, putative [Ichthyophthirius multifiliis]